MNTDAAQDGFEGPRAARPGELESVLEATNRVMRVSAGHEPTIANDYPFIYNEQNLENIMIIKHGSRVVSSVAIWVNAIEIGAACLKVGGINCLVTLPEYRRRGLASQVMRASHDRMAKLGCHVARLSTSIANWYRRLGWEAAGSFCTYELNNSNLHQLPALGDGVNLRCTHNEFEEGTLDTLVRLHQADRLGGVRTPELMRTLLQAGSDPKVKPDTWIIIALHGEKPLAYALDRHRVIVEWAGPSDVVAGLLRAWSEERARVADKAEQTSNADFSDKLILTGPPKGHSLLRLFGKFKLPCRIDYWGMLYVVDPRGILDAFGCQDIGLQERGSQFALELGEERLTVTRQQLTKLLFGPERTSDFGGGRLPFVFWQWPLEHV